MEGTQILAEYLGVMGVAHAGVWVVLAGETGSWPSAAPVAVFTTTIEMLGTVKKGVPVHTCTDILKLIFGLFAHLWFCSASEPPNYYLCKPFHFLPPLIL